MSGELYKWSSDKRRWELAPDGVDRETARRRRLGGLPRPAPATNVAPEPVPAPIPLPASVARAAARVMEAAVMARLAAAVAAVKAKAALKAERAEAARVRRAAWQAAYYVSTRKEYRRLKRAAAKASP